MRILIKNLGILLFCVFIGGCSLSRMRELEHFEQSSPMKKGVRVICIKGQGPSFTGSGSVAFISVVNIDFDTLVVVGENCEIDLATDGAASSGEAEKTIFVVPAF